MSDAKLTTLPAALSNAPISAAGAKSCRSPALGNPDSSTDKGAFAHLLADLEQPLRGALPPEGSSPHPAHPGVAKTAPAPLRSATLAADLVTGESPEVPNQELDESSTASLTPLQKALKLATRRNPNEARPAQPADAARPASVPFDTTGAATSIVAPGIAHQGDLPAASASGDRESAAASVVSPAGEDLSAQGPHRKPQADIEIAGTNAPETVIVSDVRQETHLAPAVPLFAQLADAVASHARAGQLVQAMTPSATPQPLAAPAKTLTLQLQPGDLGAVDVRLHLVGEALNLQLTVRKATTLQMVARDSDRLVEALGQSGYALDSLIIRQAGPVLPSDQPRSHGEPSGGSGSSFTQDQNNGSSASSGGSSNHASQRQGGRRPDHAAQTSLRGPDFRVSGRFL